MKQASFTKSSGLIQTNLAAKASLQTFQKNKKVTFVESLQKLGLNDYVSWKQLHSAK